MDDKKIEFLYNEYAKGKGFTDYNEFRSLLENPSSRKVFFDESNSDMGFTDLTDFENTIGISQKKTPSDKFSQDISEAFGVTKPKLPLTNKGEVKPATKLDALRERLDVTRERNANTQDRLNKRKVLSEIEADITKQQPVFEKKISELKAIAENSKLPLEQRKAAQQGANALIDETNKKLSQYEALIGEYNQNVQKEKQYSTDLIKKEKNLRAFTDEEYSTWQNFAEQLGHWTVEGAAGLLGMANTIGLTKDPESTDEDYQEDIKNQTRDKVQKIRDFGESIVTQVKPEDYQSLFKGKFSAGKLLDFTLESVATSVPTIAAGLVTGGVGAGAMGAGMMFNESKDVLKSAGLSDEEAEYGALGLAIPLGLLEKYGVEDVISSFRKSGAISLATKEFVKQVAGKKLTRKQIFDVAQKTLGETIKKEAPKIFVTGLKESGTEVLQGSVNEVAKQVAQEFTGVDEDENLSSEEYWVSQLEQKAEEAIGGFTGGASMQVVASAVGNARKNPITETVYSKAVEYKIPEMMQEFEKQLSVEVEQGIITPEQATEAVDKVKSIQLADDKVPPSVTDGEARAQAVGLLMEKQALEQEIEGKDPSMIGKQIERLNEINGLLTDISNTNQEAVDIERIVSELEDLKEDEKEKTEEGVSGVLDSEAASGTATETVEEIKAPTQEQIMADVSSGNFVTFEYADESQIPTELQGKVSSKGETNGKPTVRITLPKSEADYLLQKTKQTLDTKSASQGTQPISGKTTDEQVVVNNNEQIEAIKEQAPSVSQDLTESEATIDETGTGVVESQEVDTKGQTPTIDTPKIELTQEEQNQVQALDLQKKIVELTKDMERAPNRPRKGVASKKQIRTQINNYKDQLRELEGKPPRVKPKGSVISRAISRFQSEVEVGNLSNEERLVLDLVGRVSETDKDVQGIDKKQVANQKKNGVVVKDGLSLNQIITDFISENELDPEIEGDLRTAALSFLSRDNFYEWSKSIKERESAPDPDQQRDDEYYSYGYELADEYDFNEDEVIELEQEIDEILLQDKTLTDEQYEELQRKFDEGNTGQTTGEKSVDSKSSKSDSGQKKTESQLEQEVKAAEAEFKKADEAYTKAKKSYEKAFQESQINLAGNARQDEMLFKTDLKALNKRVQEAKDVRDTAKETLDKAKQAQQDFVPENQVGMFDEDNFIRDEEGNIIFEPKVEFTQNTGTVGFNSMADKAPDLFSQQDEYETSPQIKSITLAERVIEETGIFEFTGRNKIKSSADVAYLMRNLESEASENAFAVLVDGKGNFQVVFISTGSTSGTILDLKPIIASASKFGAKKVYFVHNHPSGGLKPSDSDRKIHKLITGSMETIGVKTEDSVIINLDSGNYATFNSQENTEEQRPSALKKGEKETPAKVYKLTRQILYEPSVNRFKIVSASDVAEFLSRQKRGMIAKTQALILDRQNRVVKVVMYDSNVTPTEMTKLLAIEVANHGESVILATTGGVSENVARDIINELKKSDISLMDIVQYEQDNGIIEAYKSFMSGDNLAEEPNTNKEYDNEITKLLPNTLSPEEKQGILEVGGENATATIITNEVHRTSKSTEGGGKNLSTRQIKNREAQALEEHAKANGTWIEKEFGKPDASGAEQDVYFSEDGKIATKVNSNVTHETWKDFFDRLAVHNALFPESPYKVVGFTNHEGVFSVVMEQPFISKGGKIKFSEVQEHIANLGFEPSTDPKDFEDSNAYTNKQSGTVFVNKNTGVKISDLHGENVIKGENGEIYFIDPIIEFTQDRKDNPEKYTSEPNTTEKVLSVLDSLKIDTRNTMGAFGLAPVVWNKAIDILKAAVKAGISATEAIQKAIDYIKSQNEKNFDETNFKAFFEEKLGVVTQTPTEDKKEAVKEREKPKNAEERRFGVQMLEQFPELYTRMSDNSIFYNTLPNEKSLEQANALIDRIGEEEAERLYREDTGIIGGAVKTMIAMVLIKRYQANGQFDKAIDLAEYVSVGATEMGQTIQALAKFAALTPEGALRMAERTVSKTAERKGKADKKRTDKVKKEFKKANKAAVEGALDNPNVKKIIDKHDKIEPKVSPTSTEYGNKNKIVTKSRAAELRKALRSGKFFSNIPPELIELGVYHIEAGSRAFVDFSKAMISEVGNKVKPYLKDLYKKAREEYSTISEDNEGLSTDLEIDTEIALQKGQEAIKNVEKALASRNRKAIQKAIAELQQVGKETGLWGKYRDYAVNRIKNMPLTFIETDIKETPILQEFTDGLAKNLREKAMELMPEAQAKKTQSKPAIEVIADAYKNIEKYQQVWEAAMDAFRKKYADNPEVLEQLDAYFGEIMTKPFSDRMIKSAVKEGLKEMNVSVADIIKEHYTVYDAVKQTLTEKLIKKAGLSEQEAKELASAVQKEFDTLATDAKKKALARIISKKQRSKPETKGLEEDLIRLTNLGAFSDADVINQWAEKMGYPKLTAEQAETIKKLADIVQNTQDGFKKFRAIEDLLNYQANLKGVDKADVAMAVWYANILSGFSTQEVNLVANMVNSMLLMGNMILQNPTHGYNFAKAFLMGLWRGKHEGAETFRTGYSPIRGKVEAPTVLERIKFKGLASPLNYAKYVGRAMKASDVMVFEALKEMRAYQLAVKKIGKEPSLMQPGETVKQAAWRLVGNTDVILSEAKEQAQLEYEQDVEDINNTQMTAEERTSALKQAKRDKIRRVYELMEAERKVDIKKESADYAARGTYNYKPEGLLGLLTQGINQFKYNLARKAENTEGKVAKTALNALKMTTDFIIPFTNIIANVANENLNYTPIGLLLADGAKQSSFFNGEKLTAEQRVDLRVKALMGTSLMVALYIASNMNGDDDEPIIEISGGGSGDYAQDYQLKETGWQPYSIKVGDTWVSYQYSPLMIALGAIGDINDRAKYGKQSYQDKDFADKSVFHLRMATKALMNMTFLSGLNTFVNSIFDDKSPLDADKVKSSLGKSAASFVMPNAYNQLAKEVQRATNTPLKNVRGSFWGQFAQNIPVARNAFYDQLNVLGEPVIPDTDRLTSAEVKHKYFDLLTDKGFFVSTPNIKQQKLIDAFTEESRPMTEAEFYSYVAFRGEQIKSAIDQDMEDLKAMNKKDFSKRMSGIVEAAGAIAKTKITNGEVFKK